MELFAIILCISALLSLSSAFKLVQKIPIEFQYQRPSSPAIYEINQNFGSILPFDETEEEESSVISQKTDTVDQPQQRQRRSRDGNRRNLRSLLNNLRGSSFERSTNKVDPMCFFTALPCRSIRQSN